MTSLTSVLERMTRKFQTRARLDEGDIRALRDLPYQTRWVEQSRYIVREGDQPPGATLILSGLAIRHKVTIEGARQILSVHIPGDFRRPGRHAPQNIRP